jgi:TPR repeat protein
VLGRLLLIGALAGGFAESARAQDSKAIEGLIRLADLYYAGNGVPQDFAKAYDLYRKAAEAGSLTGKLQMGEMLAKGEGVPQDTGKGLSLMTEVAETGSASAYVGIGDLLSEGEALAMRPAEAIRTYKKAAELGSVTALLKLGDISGSGRFGSRRPAEASAYYEKAAKDGDPFGMFAIGRHLSATSAKGSKAAARGFALLQKANAAGVPYAAVAIADDLFYGLGTKPNAQKAVAGLDAAARAGNSVAAAALVEAHRNGKRDGRATILKKNSKRAADLLAELAPNMSAADRARERFLNGLVKATNKDFGKLYKELSGLPSGAREAIVSNLPDENGPFYAFVMQSRLAELGYFKAAPQGRLDSATIRAANAFCRAKGTAYFCSHGPMSGQMAEILSRTF